MKRNFFDDVHDTVEGALVRPTSRPSAASPPRPPGATNSGTSLSPETSSVTRPGSASLRCGPSTTTPTLPSTSVYVWPSTSSSSRLCATDRPAYELIAGRTKDDLGSDSGECVAAFLRIAKR